MPINPMAPSGHSTVPVGTLAEIEPLNLDRSNVASCSLKSDRNQGCAYYRMCRFRMIRDGHTLKGADKPLAGPEGIAVYRQLSPAEGGESAILEMPCYQYYASGLHDRYEQMHITGETIKVIGIAGQRGKDGKPLKFKFEETVRAHAKRDPNCDACHQGKCIQTKRIVVEREIAPMPRPAERFKRHRLGQEIRESVLMQREREHEEAAFDPDAYTDIG